MYGEVLHIVSFAVFGATLFLMFAASALYHLIHASEAVILWLKRIDHIAIFLLIAGTYTPFCLIPLYGNTGLIYGVELPTQIPDCARWYRPEAVLDFSTALAIHPDLCRDGLAGCVRF